MPKDMFNVAELAKEKGNVAFASKDYVTAKALYSLAMEINPSNYIYPLNRSMANLKLERWDDAKSDSTKALELSPNDLKALFRRSTACKELGQMDLARDDIQTFLDQGGSQTDGSLILEAITKATGAPPSDRKCGEVVRDTPENDQAKNGSALFIVRDSTSTSNGQGAFAARDFKRGDLILSEKPILSIPTEAPGRLEAKVRKLSPAHLAQFLSLHNSHTDCACYPTTLMGLFSTNSFSLDDATSGIAPRASRFNHSCAPNARHSFNVKTGLLKIYALGPIAAGEEIFISYMSGRRVYGRPRRARRADLRARYHFTCACSACALPDAEAKKSDARRVKLSELWDEIPRFAPTQGAQRLGVIVKAVRMLKEEGFWADADDFTNDATVMCIYHSDWVSAKYWAELTYQTRVDEFGEDSMRVDEVRAACLNPTSLPLAGLGPLQLFTDIRV